MEKLAIRLQLQNSIIYNAIFFTIILVLLAIPTKAQDTNSSSATVKNDSITVQKNIVYEKGKEYILGGISVTGLQKFTESTVKVFTGLKIGQPLKLPGDKLTSAIKKLYESKQFRTVEVYLLRVDGNTIYLEFDVKELPQLNQISIAGIKKNKSKKLQRKLKLSCCVIQVIQQVMFTVKKKLAHLSHWPLSMISF